MNTILPVTGRLLFYLRRRIFVLVGLTTLAVLAVVVIVRAGLIDPERVVQLGITLSGENGNSLDPALALMPWRWALSWLTPIGAAALAIGGPLVRDWPESTSFTLSLPPARFTWTVAQVAIALVTTVLVLSAGTVGVLTAFTRLGVPPADPPVVIWTIASVAAGGLVWAWFGAFASVATRSKAMAWFCGLLLLAFCKVQRNSLVAFMTGWLTSDAASWEDVPSWAPVDTCLVVAGTVAALTFLRVRRSSI